MKIISKDSKRSSTGINCHRTVSDQPSRSAEQDENSRLGIVRNTYDTYALACKTFRRRWDKEHTTYPVDQVRFRIVDDEEQNHIVRMRQLTCGKQRHELHHKRQSHLIARVLATDRLRNDPRKHQITQGEAHLDLQREQNKARIDIVRELFHRGQV